ncbi:MAG: TIGR04100 family radical SAM protein [Huintestinicola sp.]|uniref:TIGR04100 family radical SAM protein n=1 Tax=Huintestinicola sp. TaxID=2981661 RepID=UPI003F0E90B9
MKSLTFVYAVHSNLYINLTNRCPCNCTFCIRHNGDGAYGSDSLWLEREPTCEEVLAEFEKYDMSKVGEIVFCGYGEPMERAEDVSYIGKELKKRYPDVQIRLNTNGLGDKINGRPTAMLLEGAVDIVSISLNSGNREDYNKVTRPGWEDSFEAMLTFAEECKKYVPKVMFTVVDVISEREINESKALSDKLGIPLRIRAYDT